MTRTQFIIASRQLQRRRRQAKRTKARVMAAASVVLLSLVALAALASVARSATPGEIAAFVAMQTALKQPAAPPAAPAPVAKPTIQRGAPSAVRGGAGESTRPAIKWVTPEEAAKSPKPDWWHCSAPKGVPCPPCERAEKLLADPRVVAWSSEFDCVRASAPAPYPCDIFTDGRLWIRKDGCPATVMKYMDRLDLAKRSLTETP